MSTALTLSQDMPLSQIGQVFAKSGFFADSRDAAQAIVKIMAGAELGFPPVASMTGVYIVKGRPSISAVMMAAMVKRSGKYNYRIRELTETVASIEFFEGKDSLGVSTFTLADAKKAQTQNIDKFPRNMLYARAMSNGVRWYTPDLFGGPVYTPDELGAAVDEEGRPERLEAVATHAEVIDTATGEITSQEPPRAAQNGTGKAEAPYYRFLKRCAALKAEMGEETYYRVLREFDLTSSKDVGDDLGLMKAVVEALEAEKVLLAIDPQPEMSSAAREAEESMGTIADTET